MPHIDYYFATISPYTYLAGTRLEEIAARHSATITYKPIDVIGIFGRTGGVPPKERHISRQEYRLMDMARQARKLKLDFNAQPNHWPTNPAPSAYAIIAAQATGGGDLGGLVHALTKACWAEQKDVAEDAVIRAALTENGFDADLADKGLLAGAETYAANTEAAVAAGVFGAPFYITDAGDRFWGQDRLEDLDLTLAGAL